MRDHVEMKCDKRHLSLVHLNIEEVCSYYETRLQVMKVSQRNFIHPSKFKNTVINFRSRPVLLGLTVSMPKFTKLNRP